MNPKKAKDYDIFLRTKNLPSNANDEVRQSYYEELFEVLPQQPKKLFRYRAVNEYNIQAFINDELVFIPPCKYNDPYDSLPYVNKDLFLKTQKLFASKEYILKMKEYVTQYNIFPPELQLNNENGSFDFLIELYKSETVEEIQSRFKKNENDIKLLLEYSIFKLMNFLKTNTRTACLSKDVGSYLMWAHYADSHKGFAVEYETGIINNLQISCGPDCKNIKTVSLYEVIYSNKRYDATLFTEYFYELLSTNKINYVPINKDIQASTKAQLYKSCHWRYEKEWRAILGQPKSFHNDAPVAIPNIKPSAIYLGSKMPIEYKKIFKNLAKEKHIKCYEMEIDETSPKYKMKKRRLILKDINEQVTK